MLQSSLSAWLKKPSANKPETPPPVPPPAASAAPRRPPPPPKSMSAPPRMPSNGSAPPSSSLKPTTMDNWNDIPEDFLSAPSSRPRSKKSPRPSAPQTPATVSRATTPVPPAEVPAQPESPPTTQTKPTAAATSPEPKASLFALQPLPSNVTLAPLTQEHMQAFKQLNALTLPIPYPESFYRETMTEPHSSVTLIALWTPSPNPTHNDQDEEEGYVTVDPATTKPRLVAAIRCRVQPGSQLYISTLSVLSPYRAHGLAMHLLQSVVQRAVAEHGVRTVTAHVWEANEEGREWYAKRRFEVLGMEEGYYRKLKPSGALLVRKTIGVGDLLG